MMTIKELKNQLKLNEWELKKACIDSNGNRIIELNTARVLLLESLVQALDTKLNKKHLVAKVS
jgi:hypothetical protein